jgi:hypothetical protein
MAYLLSVSRDFSSFYSSFLRITSHGTLVEPLPNGCPSRLASPGSPGRTPSPLLAAGSTLLAASPAARSRDEVVQPLVAFPVEVCTL